MRIIKTLAAVGLAASALAVGTGAQAHDRYYGHYDRDYRYDHDRYDHDRYDRYDRYDRGRHYGWHDRDRYRGYGWRDHRRCWTEWRWHHRVTVCR